MGCFMSSTTDRLGGGMTKRQNAIVQSRIDAQLRRQEEAHKKNVKKGLEEKGEFGRGIHDVKYTDSHLAALAKVTHFNVNMLRQLESLFVLISDSVTEDHLIDKNELGDALGLHPESLLLRTIFRLFDVTRNNNINFRTWILTLSSQSPTASIYEKLKFSFDICDLDGNGFIAQDEVTTLQVAAVRDILPDQRNDEVEQQCKQTVTQVDQDGDGNIDYTEYERVMQGNPFFLDSFTIDVEKLQSVLQRHNSTLGVRLNTMLEQQVHEREVAFKTRKEDRQTQIHRGSAIDLMEEARVLCEADEHRDTPFEELTLIQAQELVWSNNSMNELHYSQSDNYSGNIQLSESTYTPVKPNGPKSPVVIYPVKFDLDTQVTTTTTTNHNTSYLVVKPNTLPTPIKSSLVESQMSQVHFVLPSIQQQQHRRASLQLDEDTMMQLSIPESYVPQQIVLDDSTVGVLYLPKNDADKLHGMVVYDNGQSEPIVVISDLQDLDVEEQKVLTGVDDITKAHPLQKLLAKMRNWQDDD